MILLLALLSCNPEVGLIKTTIVDQPSETGLTTVADTALPQRAGITGYTYLHLKQVACPACVGEVQEITINFSAQFHQPITDSHTQWLPLVGQCTENLIGISPSTIPISIGDYVAVSSPTHTFYAYTTNQGHYETSNIWESDLLRDAIYTAATEEGNYNFLSSRGFDFIEPYTLFWIDPSYAFDAPIYRSGASFTWAPTSLEAIFNIIIAVYSFDGSQLLGYVSCTGNDNGSMTIPGQYLQQYPVGSLTAVHLSRHKIELEETDINNSYIETHMEWEVIGTGHIE